MDIHRYQWIAMDIHENQWISLNIHGHPGISMDNHGYHCISMDILGFPLIFMGIHMDLNRGACGVGTSVNRGRSHKSRPLLLLFCGSQISQSIISMCVWWGASAPCLFCVRAPTCCKITNMCSRYHCPTDQSYSKVRIIILSIRRVRYQSPIQRLTFKKSGLLKS